MIYFLILFISTATAISGIIIAVKCLEMDISFMSIIMFLMFVAIVTTALIAANLALGHILND